jgi:hypothetical protein
MVDDEDLKSRVVFGTWTTCFYLIENEVGQPLQRWHLVYSGRLTSMVGPKGNYATLSESMVTASFCKALGQALAFDHRKILVLRRA